MDLGSAIAFEVCLLTKVDDENWGEVVTDVTVVIGLTPANDREFYHMTAMCTSFKQDQKDWDIQLHVIHQDVEAAARMQTYYEKHWQDAVEVSIPLDRPGLLARRMVAKKVKAERASVEHKSC